MKVLVLALPVLGLLRTPLVAQVAIDPPTVEPAAWIRFGLQVVNQRDAAITEVRLEVPEALAVLGTGAPAGWSYRLMPASDTTPQAVEWTGGALERGAYQEFTFLARVIGDARRRELVFPVQVTRSDGGVSRWGRAPGDTPPPGVMIRGSTFITSWGAAALGGAALGVSALALAIALFRRTATVGGSGPGS